MHRLLAGMSKVAPLSTADEETTDVLLLRFESGSFGLQGEGITTITFVSTADRAAATAQLKQRLARVAASNPWLCGTIVKEPQHGSLYALRYPKAVVSVETIFAESETSLPVNATYVELVAAVKKSGATLPIGKKLFQAQQPICKLTIAPSASGFILLFSMSHMVANGGTYTQILNMIASEATPITALCPMRKQECYDKIPDVVGKKQHAYMMGDVGNICNALGKLMCGSKPVAHCFIVDDDKLKVAREQAAASFGGQCSANDVLTSGEQLSSPLSSLFPLFSSPCFGLARVVPIAGFANAVKPRLLNMAVDFKGRIDGLSTNDAGNYHLGIYFDPQGYASPGSIRGALKSSPPMSRAALPGCWEGTFCKTAIITSWAGFKGLDMPGCTQTMHVPCADIAGLLVKALDATAIVFNPQPDKIAILCCVKGVEPSQLRAAMPLGDALDPKLWPVV